jgi:hypothetical protein
MCSHWTGDAENAFYSSEKIDRCRNLTTPEYQWTSNKGLAAKINNSSYYVLGVDVGRFQCTTEVCVFKVVPQSNSAATKSLVNIYTYSAEHFGEQAI